MKTVYIFKEHYEQFKKEGTTVTCPHCGEYLAVEAPISVCNLLNSGHGGCGKQFKIKERLPSPLEVLAKRLK